MKQLNWYQIFGKSNIPDGRTVLPTDDIQIWLHCANIWDKTYTTLAEVLADTDTLSALIASSNAVDYMVRSTTWAVAQALVPTMTSDTTPSGRVIYSSTYPSAGDIPYHCFDNNTSTNGCSALISSNTATTWWVGYTFTSPTVINRAKITSLTMTRGSISTPIKIQGSNDAFSSDVHDLYSFDSVVSNADVYFNNDTEYTSYRLLVTANADSQSGEHYVKFAELQFYSASITDNATAMSYIGLNNYCTNTLIADTTWLNAIGQSEYKESVLNVKVPKMTSNTQPSGECFVDQTASWFEPYYFFDGNTSRHGGWAQNSYPHWFAYDFGRAVTIVGFEWYAYAYYGGRTIPMLLEYSDDKSTWNSYGDTVNAVQSVSWSAMATHTSGAHRYWRIYCATQGTADSIAFGEVQFYGREDV